MDAVFLKVLNMSITASYVIAAVLIIRLLIRKAPKRYSYLLWSAAGFRLCCPISFQSIFSLFSLSPFDMTRAQSAGAAMLEYVPQSIAQAPQPQITAGIPAANSAIAEILPAAAPAASVNPMQIWIAVGTALWCAGILAFLIYGVVSFLKLRRRMASAVLLEGNVYQSEHVRSPFILGLFRPKIYIPFGLDERTRRYVLAHERHHIRRFDHVIKPFAFLLLAVHWFNPLCYLAFYLMGKDMEMSCDERVLAGESNIRKSYSVSLLSFAANRRFPSPSPLAFGETSVKSRIKNVLNWKRPKVWVTLLVAALCVAAVAACAANPAQPKEQAQPFGHTYRVESLVYDSLVYSFSYTPQTAPLYRIDRIDAGWQLSVLENQETGDWLRAGSFDETALTEGSFDRYFLDSGWQEKDLSAALRRENQKAWQLDVPDSENAVFYYLLQQNNGDVYLSYGYRGTEGGTDSSSIRWLFRLARADEISCIVGTAGREMFCKPQWYAKERFGFDNASMPAIAAYEEGTLTFLSDRSPDTLTVNEDYFAYPNGDEAVREEHTYELQKNADGGYMLDVRRRNDARDEYAVYRIETGSGCYALKVLFPLQDTETLTDIDETAVAYVTSECLYMNPLSSFAAINGDNGCRYLLGDNSFYILDRSSGSVQAVSSLLSPQWQEFPYTKEGWLSLFAPRLSSESAVSSLNFTAPAEIPYRYLDEHRFLLNVKNQLWLVETRENAQMGRFIWSVYTLVPEANGSAVQWQFRPQLSSVYPAFPLYFNLPCAEVSAACTAGTLLCLDTDQRGASITVPTGSVLYWSPFIADDSLQTEESAQITFSAVFNGESTARQGTVYIARDADTSGNAAAVYNASLAGSGLIMKQTDAWPGGAVISSTQAVIPSMRADLDRDGAEELLVVEQSDSYVYMLKVLRPDGTLLWSEPAGTSHAGWNSLFLCTLDGESCLMRYNPSVSQGYGDYAYSLFTLENGTERVVAENSIHFTVDGLERITPEMTAFADEVNALLKNSTLLVSTQYGNAVIGPISAEGCLENYEALELE